MSEQKTVAVHHHSRMKRTKTERYRDGLLASKLLPPMPSDPSAPTTIMVSRDKGAEAPAPETTMWLRSWIDRDLADDMAVLITMDLVSKRLGTHVRIPSLASVQSARIPVDFATAIQRGFFLVEAMRGCGYEPTEAFLGDGTPIAIPDGSNRQKIQEKRAQMKVKRSEHFKANGPSEVPLALLPAQDGTMRMTPPDYMSCCDRTPTERCFYTGILVSSNGSQDRLTATRDHLVPLRKGWADPESQELALLSNRSAGALVWSAQFANRAFRASPLVVKLAVRERMSAIDYERDTPSDSDLHQISRLMIGFVRSLRIDGTLPWDTGPSGHWWLPEETVRPYMTACYAQERAFLAMTVEERAAWIASGRWRLPGGQGLASDDDVFTVEHAPSQPAP